MTNLFFTVCANSLLQATLSTLLALSGALVIAHFIHLYTFMGRSILPILLAVLCIIPSKVTALGVLQFYKASGLLAIVLAHATLNLPLVVYMLAGAYARIDYTMSLVAYELGANRWQIFINIYLPLLKNALIASCGIVFVLCMTSFSICQFFADPHYFTPDIMMSHLYEQNSNQFYSYALFRLLVIGALTVWVPATAVAGSHHAQALTVYRQSCSGFGAKLWALCVSVLIFLLCAPVVMVLYTAFTWHVASYLASIFSAYPDPFLGCSLMSVLHATSVLALASSMLAVICAFLAAFFVVQAQSTVAQYLATALATFPFLISSVGCALLFSWLGKHGNWSPMVVMITSHVVLNFPFAYRVIFNALYLWQPEWDKTASALGATFRQRLLTLKLPFIKDALVQAFILSFGLSLTEVGASSVFKNAGYLTLPMAIKIYREHGFDAGVIGLNIILLALVLLSATSVNVIGQAR